MHFLTRITCQCSIWRKLEALCNIRLFMLVFDLSVRLWAFSRFHPYKNTKPLKTVRSNCKTNATTLTQRLTKVLPSDRRTTSFHRFWNPAKNAQLRKISMKEKIKSVFLLFFTWQTFSDAHINTVTSDAFLVWLQTLFWMKCVALFPRSWTIQIQTKCKKYNRKGAD